MKKFLDFLFAKNKRPKINPVVMSMLEYIQESLTEEELNSFIIGKGETKYSFMDRALAHYENARVSCSIAEARAKIYELLDWYRGLANKSSFENRLFISRFSQFLTTEH